MSLGLRGLLAASLCGLTLPAAAETLLTPSVGAVFGGDTDKSEASYGGSLAFAGRDAGLGLEVDFGYAPDFFGKGFEPNNVTTLMGNLMLISSGRTRLFASSGVGLMKTHVRSASGFFDVDSSSFGFNAGGGFYFLTDGALGLRGDIRYFRSLSDPDPDGRFDVAFGKLDYWRGTAGLVFRF